MCDLYSSIKGVRRGCGFHCRITFNTNSWRGWTKIRSRSPSNCFTKGASISGDDNKRSEVPSAELFSVQAFWGRLSAVIRLEWRCPASSQSKLQTYYGRLHKVDNKTWEVSNNPYFFQILCKTKRIQHSFLSRLSEFREAIHRKQQNSNSFGDQM